MWVTASGAGGGTDIPVCGLRAGSGGVGISVGVDVAEVVGTGRNAGVTTDDSL